MSDSENDLPASRRRLLKSVATGGSALGLTALPGKWAKPMVASVVLPAHAQTSLRSCGFSLVNCPPENRIDEVLQVDDDIPKYFPTEELPQGITYSNGFLSGSSSDSGSEEYGICPPPCDGLTASKYYSFQDSFDGSGGMTASYSLQFQCGGNPLGTLGIAFEGDYSGVSADGRGYTGSLSKYIQACYPGESPKYNGGGNDNQTFNRQSRSLSSGNYQFGGQFGDQMRNQIRDRINNRIGKRFRR